MSNGYNPYRGSDGRFKSGPSKRRIQYASSDEWKDVPEQNEEIKQNNLNYNSSEQERLQREEAIKSLDLEIASAQQSLEWEKEKYAGAWSEDDRRSAEDQIKQWNRYIKKLQSKRKSL